MSTPSKESLVLSPLGQLLGLDPAKIEYKHNTCSLDLEIVPAVCHTSEKGILHGGYMQAIVDEAMRLFVAELLGHGRAVTESTNFVFYKFGLSAVLTTVRVVHLYTLGRGVCLGAKISQKKRIIASANSMWLTRVRT